MMRHPVHFFAALLIVSLLLLTACNLPTAASPTPQPPISTFTASPLPPPTATASPLPTLLPSATPLPSATFTPVIPLAEVQKESNCRVGPAGNYELVATYPAGQKLEVIANDLGAGFLFVRNLEQPEEHCWILAANLALSGEVAALPQFTPPPSPLPAPAFSASYKNIYLCKTDMSFAFIIQNTGGSAFRSAYIKASDLKTGKSTEQALNAFDLWADCVVAKNIAPLTPGATGYLYTLPFKTDVRGHTLQIVIMACTEQNLKGECATETLQIKPR